MLATSWSGLCMPRRRQREYVQTRRYPEELERAVRTRCAAIEHRNSHAEFDLRSQVDEALHDRCAGCVDGPAADARQACA